MGRGKINSMDKPDVDLAQEVKILAPAKINLSLRIGPAGPAGLHQLSSYMQTISLYDEISLAVLAASFPAGPRKSVGDFPGSNSTEPVSEISLTCSDPALATDKSNLLYLALERWLQKAGISARLQVHLQKNIPSQAGLGGGSSDAAAGLLALQDLFPTAKLGQEELQDLAFSLGSDVPFFLTQGFAQVAGYGDKVTPLPDLAKSYYILVKPPLEISTREAFKAWDEANPEPPDLLAAPKMWSVSAPFQNDFQTLQAARYPLIQEVIDFLETSPANQVALSGSGPTIFAAYGHILEQKAWYKKLKQGFPSCQLWGVESVARPR